MEDILNIICTAEEKAEYIISDAKKQAEKILESANAEISKRKKEISVSIIKHKEKLIEEKRLLAQFECEKLDEECIREAATIVSKAKANKEKAVSYILSLI